MFGLPETCSNLTIWQHFCQLRNRRRAINVVKLFRVHFLAIEIDAVSGGLLTTCVNPVTGAVDCSAMTKSWVSETYDCLGLCILLQPAKAPTNKSTLAILRHLV